MTLAHLLVLVDISTFAKKTHITEEQLVAMAMGRTMPSLSEARTIVQESFGAVSYEALLDRRQASLRSRLERWSENDPSPPRELIAECLLDKLTALAHAADTQKGNPS